MELIEKLKKFRDEIRVQKENLTTLNNKKEADYSVKSKYSLEIKELRTKANEIKKKRDELTTRVKELKKKRKDLHDLINKKNVDLNKLNSQKEEVKKKAKIKLDPDKLASIIEKLEFKVETEALSFEKEKELMQQIY